MSKIEWTHRPGTKSEVLNPTTGCDKISQGCKFCYAEVMHRRLTGMGQRKYMQPFLGHVRYWPDELARPFRWKKPRTVFLNSMSDIFHKDVSIFAIAEIYAMMFLTSQHTYIVLTKRSNRACDVLNSAEFFEEFWAACNRLHDKYIKPLSEALYFEDELRSMWPLKNVWQGVSVESQEQDHRITELTNTPGHIRVISYEPALGPLVLGWNKNGVRVDDHGCNIHWLISGGESGHKARPAHPDWFRDIRDQCKAMGIKYFHKQWGAHAEGSKNDGENIVVLKNGDHGYYTPLTHGYSVEEWQSLMPVVMHKCRKHESGNLLDGVQHLEFPA